jgi:hypothetical protein
MALSITRLHGYLIHINVKSRRPDCPPTVIDRSSAARALRSPRWNTSRGERRRLLVDRGSVSVRTPASAVW